MGPFSEKKQMERAEAINTLLDSNPQLDDHMKSIWLSKVRNLCWDEDAYNRRVVDIFRNHKNITLLDYSNG
jgi:hypothetical protein